jgi:predicted CXXCH cytochrome family protein
MNLGKLLNLAGLLLLILLLAAGCSDRGTGKSADGTGGNGANGGITANPDGTLSAEVPEDPDGNKMRVGFSNFKGRGTCFSCHSDYVVGYRQTAHDLSMSAMQAMFVQGDFADASFSDEQGTALFHRDGGRYLVRTRAPGRAEQDYELAWCIGGKTLQQYVVKMEKGSYQVLDIAWQCSPATEGGQRWIRLPAGGPHGLAKGKDWTADLANWNTQCAVCHSSDVDINYDVQTGGFDTKFREDDITCESCHGGSGNHIGWAQNQALGKEATIARKGLIFYLTNGDARWEMNEKTGTAERRPPRSEHSEVETCMQCHARFEWLQHGFRHDRDPLHFIDPALLSEGLYHPDGQIGDVQVFEAGSFLQSREYRKGVSCADCHDPHTGRTIESGNDLCLRCHQPQKYNVPEHHHHAAGNAGAQCINCHMPQHTYAGGETRHDHSIRIPRPDLTGSIGTPNACSQCHTDLSLEEIQTAWNGWYGTELPAHFGTSFALARKGDPRSLPELEKLAVDYSQAPIVRATAFQELGRFAAPGSLVVIGKGLQESESIVRLAAVRALGNYEPQIRTNLLTPLIVDKLQAVKIEVARLLAGLPMDQLSEDGQREFAQCIDKYIASQDGKAWLTMSHVNKGWMYGMRGLATESDAAFADAERMDSANVELYLKRAEAAGALGKPDDTEKIIQQGLKHLPGNARLLVALGDDFMRRDMRSEALKTFQLAYEKDPALTGSAFGYAGVLAMESRHAEAVKVLEAALVLQPFNLALLQALQGEQTLLGNTASANEIEARLLEYYPWLQAAPGSS